MRFEHGSSMVEAGLKPVHNMAETGFHPGLNPVDVWQKPVSNLA
jgi:hypothetical protein